MKPIHNKLQFFCGCSVVKRRKRNGRNVPYTTAEHDKIVAEYSNMEKLCQLYPNGDCMDVGYSGHTRIGIKYQGVCKKCGYTKAIFMKHTHFPEETTPTVTIETPTSRGLPVPLLRRPTAELIMRQNEEIEERENDWYDDYDCQEDDIYDEEYDDRDRW